MAILKKTATAEPYRIPSLAESDPSFGALIAKQTELHNRYVKLRDERSKLSREIEAEKAAGGQRLSPEVAALLGDAPDSLTMLTQRQREIATEMSTIEAGQEVILRRLDEARTVASKLVCSAMLPEYRRRLGAVCDAARALEDAREQHDALLDDIEREDVRLDYLRPVRAHFLGDRKEGRVFYFVKEVREAGHNV
ncbi:hypothetical protein J4G48_0020225 [Bradyrhizobium barranii subsp. apii]|uniref:hypothetical protein n=1 Tax=Bradyrhizobium barranii TaxID=2992140 RepID=UPI001AA1447A|nr:hypothetical protein [Bradyrhizobium barranii]UPU00211.1 hypothetical protein J4G48_0020225 [Bradyrhizobium barranii subsp. apii]